MAALGGVAETPSARVNFFVCLSSKTSVMKQTAKDRIREILLNLFGWEGTTQLIYYLQF